MPLLKSLGFLPTMPQLNYKISALEQVLDARSFSRRRTASTARMIPSFMTMFPLATPRHSPARTESPWWWRMKCSTTSALRPRPDRNGPGGRVRLGQEHSGKLLIHYYDPQKGSISIGGQKLCDMSLEALNSRISYVAQDQYLFNTSLLENIRIGRLNATDEEVLEAARKAQCMEFLEKLPQGIHSMAGDAGKMLSGGQRQRISLARAILKDAPIVVLDEATAYADPRTRRRWRRRLRSW